MYGSHLRVSTDSIRFYEREGLLHPAKKSAAGYRLYTEESVRRLNFIKHAQQCGFPLREIRELLEIKGQDRACCNDVYRVAIEKKLRLESKIKAFKAMSQALTKLVEILGGVTLILSGLYMLNAYFFVVPVLAG